ncbi:MAG TPA: presenilin family intramembrane aspartyl protease, partial [Candidatus Deferrimicrobiaceae bacterium]|nr:presenilin family intramembrane aspartyl protease [Candidatus Deferrimicrobiaceae bacterium]
QKPELPKSETDRFKFDIIYLLPILGSLLFGLVCAYVLAPVPSESVPVTPIPEEIPGAQWGNALYFVVLIALAATLFYILLKRRSKRIIKGLIVVALTTASLLLSLVYLSALFAYAPSWDFLVIPLSIALTVFFDFVIFRLGRVPRDVVVVCLGGALGIFFGKFIPLWSAVLILVFLAIYDIFAVYKGPVGKIAESGLDQLQGLSFSFKDIQMGLGDLVFYSMLSGIMFFSFLPNVIPTIAAVIGILVGSIITLFMLEKKGIFPGLPFPILLGLALGLFTGFLL